MTSYILYYNSQSHKKTRYFVGSETVNIPCQFHPKGHDVQKPSWTYDKEGATIFDSKGEGEKAKQYAEHCGYKDLVLEPIDEQTIPAKQVEETLH